MASLSNNFGPIKPKHTIAAIGVEVEAEEVNVFFQKSRDKLTTLFYMRRGQGTDFDDNDHDHDHHHDRNHHHKDDNLNAQG